MMNAVKEKLSPEESIWGWKLLIVACILSFIFMSIFYLAVTNDPEYMPNHKQKYTQEHVYKSSPTMQPLSPQQPEQAAQTQKAHHE